MNNTPREERLAPPAESNSCDMELDIVERVSDLNVANEQPQHKQGSPASASAEPVSALVTTQPPGLDTDMGHSTRRRKKRGPYNSHTTEEQAMTALNLAYVHNIPREEIAEKLSMKYSTLTTFLRQQKKLLGLPPLPNKVRKRKCGKRSSLRADILKAYVEKDVRANIHKDILAAQAKRNKE